MSDTLMDEADLSVFEAHAEVLKEAIKPFRTEWKRREKLSTFVDQCARSASRGDFFSLSELVGSRQAAAVREEAELEAVAEALDGLSVAANAAIDRYRLQFIEDLVAQSTAAGLALRMDFPRFTTRPGIEGTVDFAARKVVINGNTLKSVDPKRIVGALARVEKDLYGRPFDPAAFVEELYGVYCSMISEGGARMGENVSIVDFYLKLVLSRQSRQFFVDLKTRGFRGYGVDELAVDLWRYTQQGSGRTASGHALRVAPGRGRTLWLLDGEGERRQLSSIAFEEVP